VSDDRTTPERILDTLHNFRDGEFGELLLSVKRIADGVHDIQKLATALAERDVVIERRKRNVLILDTIASLEQAAAVRNVEHPGFAFVPQSDLALVCRVTRQLLRYA